ncbi:N-acetylglutaminylglutamine synthetase [Nitrospina gracilis]|uniref:N-acetylglutaminylglutamine synthetase n=1 Tax=Nitrospina gracilis TaxID=35801 RepID=UPI001F00AE4F|nr:N-acetylglutaminylglutamine synthetase [Nitrospina gracilis]MCF8721661.1 GNAT-family acetyltransferase (TIGR03103 family) [Nitrospina gracilis Nb-211]
MMKTSEKTPRRFIPISEFRDVHKKVSEAEAPRNVAFDCGWGRLVFANTFTDSHELVHSICQERKGKRDIALYIHDPQVALSLAPQELFLDPSHTLRLWLSNYEEAGLPPRGFTVRPIQTRRDIQEANRIYKAHNMVQIPVSFAMKHKDSPHLVFRVVEDNRSGKILAMVQGVDHTEAFGDPNNGSSLWSLAVDPHAEHPGIGEALVRNVAEYFRQCGRSFMDLSVIHDNEQAMALYEKLGFEVARLFFIKKKNPINEKLFIGSLPESNLNPYARIIINEARRRGIGVHVLDEKAGYFSLTFGGRTLICRESLSELTSSIAMSLCADKAVTRRFLNRQGLPTPDQIPAGSAKKNREFLNRHGDIVVKPADGEQGAGITIKPADEAELKAAIDKAQRVSDHVLLEEFVEGIDLRIIVINFEVVAAAVRHPAQVIGDGRSTVKQLTMKQSRRRAAATGGEAKIPLDAETEQCIRDAGYAFDSVPESGTVIPVRKTANLHTGGTIFDVTADLNPKLAEAAVAAAKAIHIPVVGFDFMVPTVNGEQFKIIEANERPGLANHEPQPTAERFIDLLFPQTRIDTHEGPAHPTTFS